ncbi:MAG: cytochrome c oxidase subunit II [Candidatus Comchoanobacterales bacterium]
MSLQMTYNLPRGVTEVSKGIYDLHMWVFYICVAIMVVVSAILFYVVIRYRKTKTHKTLERGQPHSDFWIEFLWTLIPTIIVVLMMIPATKLIWKVGADDEKAINIRVIGRQWYWQYDYVDEDGVSISSRPFDEDLEASKHAYSWTTTDDAGNTTTHHRHPYYMSRVTHPLVLPSHRNVRFLITSSDVIHSWFMPAFGIKQDAVPSYTTAVWANISDPGDYYGQCAELCGAHHAHMPITVLVRPQYQYDQYIQELKDMREKGVDGLTTLEEEYYASLGSNPIDQTATATPQPQEKNARKGKVVYDAHCSGCHAQAGMGAPHDREKWKTHLDAHGGSLKELAFKQAWNGYGGMLARGTITTKPDILAKEEFVNAICHMLDTLGKNTETCNAQKESLIDKIKSGEI